MIVHNVFFWLKDGTEPAQRDRMLADCTRLLAKIPSVRHLWAGRPLGTPREVVDNSYDIALCTIMDDQAGLDVYQDHPLHLEFLKLHKPTWKRVQIYDAVE